MSAPPTQINAASMSKAAKRARRAASGRMGPMRWLFLLALGIYFFLPLIAMARFAFQRYAMAVMTWDKAFDGWSFQSLADAVTDQRTVDSGLTSLKLAVATIVVTVVLLLPTAIFVEIKARNLRPALLILTMAPWIVPPIALVVGVAGTFRSTAPWFLSSIWCLVPFYTLWALPFAYRAIDGGLRAIDVKTLYEASRSLGASVPAFVLKVILPNIVPALLVVSALTAATVLGEFAFASLLLKQTLPTNLIVISGGDPRGGTALSLLVLVVTTIVIGLAAAVLRRRGISFNAAGI